MPHDTGSGPQPPPKPRKPRKPPKPPRSNPARDQHNHPSNPPAPAPRRPHHHRRDPLQIDLTPPVTRMQRRAARQQRKSARYLRQHNVRSQAVMRRQTVLRAAGFNVRVDGVWGPNSQFAWQQFNHGQDQRGRPIGSTAGAPYAVPKGPLPLTQHQRDLRSLSRDFGFGVAGARAGAKAARDPFSDAHRQADRNNLAAATAEDQLAAQARRVKAVATRIAANPDAAAKISLRLLTDVLTSPDSGLDVTSHAGARAAQSWLAHHGFHVAETASWDKQTHDAFTRALHDEQRRIEERQNRQVLNQLYRPAGLHAGDEKPDWLPGLAGHRVPQPGELLHILQRGGFSAGLLYNALIQHSQDGNWRDFQHTQLLRLAAKFQPFALGIPGLHTRIGNGNLYANLIGTIPQLQLSPYGSSKYGQRDEARRQAQLIGQVNALYAARDVHDFQRKLGSFTQQAERQQLQLEQERAARHVGFFGHALELVIKPGQYVRTGLVAAGDSIAYSFTHLGRVTQVGPEAHTPDFGAQAERQIANMNPWARLAFELTVDPLNILPVGKLASTTLRFATRGETLGAYALVRTGEQGGLTGWKAGADVILNHSIRYNPGSWTKLGALEYAGNLFTHGTFGGSKAYRVALRALDTKEVALTRARERVGLAMRHGFRTPGHPTAQGVSVYSPKGQLADKIDSALTDLIAHTQRDPSGAFQAIASILTKHHVSLWMDAAKTTLSTVGASIEAYIADTLSAQIAHRLAGSAAKDVLAHGGDQEAAQAEYQRVLDSIGTHLGPRGPRAGGADELTKLVQSQHREAVNGLLDTVRNTWFRVWQRLLEDDAELNGVKLFEDETGLWAFRRGEAATELRSLARDTFDNGNTVAVANPQRGIPHTFAERSAAAEAEIRRLTSRAFAYDQRMTVGQLDSSFNVEDAVQNIRDTVNSAWHEDGGFYYDKRAEVHVSALYARHLAAASAGAKPGMAADDFLAHIAQPPKDTALASSPFNDALDFFAWRIGGRGPRSGLRPPHPASPQHLSDAVNPAAVGESSADAEVQFANQLEDLVRSHQSLLAQGYDAAIPFSMREELLLWQALTHAQSAPLRAASKALQAGLNVWIFATLPLRPGWMVRNVVDNWAKSFIAGIRDPRLWFIGAEHPGSLIRTVFDVGIYPLRQTTRFLDRLFGTDVLGPLDDILDHFWELPADVIRRVFDAHGIDAPEQAFHDMKHDPLFRAGSRDSRRPHVPGDAAKDKGYTARSRDALWELMGNRPETYWRRVIYRGTVKQETKRLTREAFGDTTAIAAEAHRLALARIEDTLFDYSNISVIEDNFRVFFPFVQFWRKNFGFWATQAFDKPWLPLSFAKWEAELGNAHSDLPAWMQRYVSTRELTDAAAVVPGLDKIVSFLIPQDAMYDPLKFSSGAPLYRSFLSLVGVDENANLPPGEGNGWPIIGPMLNAMNEWGLGTNPLIEKPLEMGGVASARSWQTVFPQAGVIIALSPDFWLERQKSGPIEWARIAALTALGADPNAIAKNLDFYIHQEIAGQVARGEKPNEAKARKVIEDWFLTQNLVGYFTGMYLRRATPSDIYMSKLYDDAVTGKRKHFTSHEQQLLHLWAMRGVNRYSYDRYLEAMPDINAYYRQPDYASSQAYLEKHPELSAYVDPAWKGEPFSHNYIKQAAVQYAADEFFRVSQLSDQLDVAYDVRRSAESLLLTPEIKAMWKANATPAARQRRMVEGLIHEQLSRVNQGYFSIPESNFGARSDYLNQHPELIRMWNANNSAADDYQAILHDANAELREQFFYLIHHGEHAAADAFLARHPFLWEDTANADHFDPQTGQMKLQFLSAKARAYMAAKPAFDKLDRLIATVGRKAAWNWLYNSSDPDAVAARAYIKAYGHSHGTAGGRSQHALDYLAVRSILNAYFNMPQDTRETWLHGSSPEAAQLRAYFAKWSSSSGMTQHARDFLAAKSALDHYFAMTKAQRRTWLNAGSPEAKQVLAYFKKYGATHKYERAYAKLDPTDVGGTPEQRQRILFWKRYFALTPDKRPNFIHQHAADYGVFIYGPLAEKQRDAQEQAWLRRAHAAHMTPKQLGYLYVKPMLDFYFQLPKGKQRQLFMETNPELEAWFQAHPPQVSTGNKQTDKFVERYFALDIPERSAFLAAYPEVQRYFDSVSSPAQRAIHSLLSQYFALTGPARKDFGLEHPEIGAYFAARLQEQANISAVSQALYETDPHLAPYRENASDMIASAQRQLERLQAAAITSFTPDSIEAHRDRVPYTGRSTGRHVQRKGASDIVPDTRARG